MSKELIRIAADQVGGVTQLAKLLGITKGAVSQWEHVPPHHVLRIESMTGISRHVMRPDIFGPSPELRRRATDRADVMGD